MLIENLPEIQVNSANALPDLSYSHYRNSARIYRKNLTNSNHN